MLASIQSVLASALVRDRRPERAVEVATAALPILRRAGRRMAELNVLTTLAAAASQTEDADGAIEALTDLARREESLGLVANAGQTHVSLANLHLSHGRPTRALTHAERADAHLRPTNHDRARGWALMTKARALHALGRAEAATSARLEAEPLLAPYAADPQIAALLQGGPGPGR